MEKSKKYKDEANKGAKLDGCRGCPSVVLNKKGLLAGCGDGFQGWKRFNSGIGKCPYRRIRMKNASKS